MRLKAIPPEKLTELLRRGQVAWQDLARHLPYSQTERCPACDEAGDYIGEITGPMCAIVRWCSAHGYFWYWS